MHARDAAIIALLSISFGCSDPPTEGSRHTTGTCQLANGESISFRLTDVQCSLGTGLQPDTYHIDGHTFTENQVANRCYPHRLVFEAQCESSYQ